jgi:DNA-binding NarL/FixJ family response regulator
MAHLDTSSHARPVRRVLVADGDPTVRSALRLVLCQAVGLNVVEEASDAAHLLVAAAASAPDLVLLDWNLPGWHPDEALTALRAGAPGATVVVLSTRPEPRRRALAAGADAFVCKADGPTLLLATLERLVA